MRRKRGAGRFCRRLRPRAVPQPWRWNSHWSRRSPKATGSELFPSFPVFPRRLRLRGHFLVLQEAIDQADDRYQDHSKEYGVQPPAIAGREVKRTEFGRHGVPAECGVRSGGRGRSAKKHTRITPNTGRIASRLIGAQWHFGDLWPCYSPETTLFAGAATKGSRGKAPLKSLAWGAGMRQNIHSQFSPWEQLLTFRSSVSGKGWVAFSENLVQHCLGIPQGVAPFAPVSQFWPLGKGVFIGAAAVVRRV